MFYTTFLKFLQYFGKGHEKQIWLMGVYTFLTSLFEFASVAIILPFLLMLIDPQLFNQNFFLKAAKQIFHLPDVQAVFEFAAIAVIVTIISKNIYGIFIMYWQNKLLKEWALDIKTMFMRMYLYSPFEMNVKTGDSERFFAISNTVDLVFEQFVFRVIVFTSNTLVVILIFSWMIYLLPKYTLLAALFFITSASLQNKIIFHKAKLFADEKYKLEQGPYNTLLSSLRCLKEIKITSSENFFYNIYKKISKKLVPLSEKINLLPIIPQYIIEIIFVFTVIILFVGIFQEYGLNRENILIALGVVAISLFRILPLMYKSQVCINYMDMYREYPPMLFELYDSFKQYENYIYEPTKDRMVFNNEIKIENLSYSYDGKKSVLSDINFKIKKGEYIGIIGISGAGKSTLVDCLTGLLLGKGNIFIDDVALIPENTKNYQNIIGYVSQNTNTVSGNLITNVAWGIPDAEINQEAIIHSLKDAKLYDQIQELPNGINTVINQDGTGLSQGQKQRIGIARAFYRNPELLIFDEATSSLDVKTENEIMEILAEKKGKITMIAVSHRLSTLKLCDKIVYMAEGKIVDIGTFAELTEKYPQFAKFVELSNLSNDND
mgnify:CR=1 FL=1